MNLRNRIKKLEHQKNFPALCQCTISDLPGLLTARELPPMCERCGNQRTEKQIQTFAERRIEGQKRLEIVLKQVKTRNQ